MDGEPSQPSHLVMCVDDDRATLDLFARFLRMQNVEVVTATSGPDALEQLDAYGTQIEMIFVDLAMPGMTGYELAAAIRSNPAIASIPIVAVTARADSLSDESAASVGIVQVVSKPFQLRQLADILAANGILT